MAELESLDGRVYAITGGSRGMGLRFARALSAEGAKVALLARPSAELEAAARELPDALAVPCDVGDSAEVKAAFAAIGRRYGQLNGLINNAAACLLHKIEESTDLEIKTEIDANLAGPIYCIREAVPLLRASGGGDIVNVSSETVRLPYPYLALYGATKAALENLSQSLRLELRPDGIRVTVLRSGQVSGSSLGSTWSPERAQAFMAEIQALGQAPVAPVAPETMAAMLVQMLRLPREANLDLVELRAF
jgi:meso-butanediol dehydrogenase/(S,S)-butanediol dehydrogenase/diacetyl reductase